MPKVIDGQLAAPRGLRVAIVAARFNSFIVDSLVDGRGRHARAARRAATATSPWCTCRARSSCRRWPAARRRRAATDAVICLGCVIRGATPHYDYVAGHAAYGIAEVAMKAGCRSSSACSRRRTSSRRVERAGTKAGNKGVDAAMAALEMVSLYAPARTRTR